MLRSAFRLPFLLLAGLSGARVTHAQSVVPEDIKARFQQYQASAFQEKLFVHIDKTVFLAGEIMWFKIYDVDGFFNKPVDASAIAYLEITDRNHRSLLQTKVEFLQGHGKGSLVLPATLSSGTYTVRAYTAWMRNFGPESFYEQTISVINALNDTTYTPPLPSRVYDIRFFPEGGNLVAGLATRIAFKGVDRSGKSVPFRGTIFDQQNDSILSFQTSHAGMGSTMLAPVAGHQYHAVIRVADTIVTVKLPTAFDRGYTLKLSDDGINIKVVVEANILLSTPALYLVTQSGQTIKSLQTSYLANGKAEFTLDKQNFADGVSRITLFNGERTAVCERSYFKQPNNQIHLDLATERLTFSPREKVEIPLLATDQSGNNLSTDLSMSVFLTDSLQLIPENDIVNYLFLSSELKGNVESPQYYFETNTPESNRDADNLMLTQGWTRFRWEDILTGKKATTESLPETEGLVISGKVSDKRTGAAAGSVTAYLSFPDTAFELAVATSRADGSIRFPVKKYYGNRELILQTNDQEDSNFRLELQSPYSDQFSSSVSPPLNVPEKWKSLLTTRSVNAQVDNTFLLKQKNHLFIGHHIDTTSFYGRPDLQYNLDDYTRFVTLEEVMREYVAGVRVRKEEGRYYFRVRNDLFNTFFDNNPLLLIDGVPVFNADKIIAFDPIKIKRIDVMARKYYLGAFVTDGIVSYKTYDGDLAGFPLGSNAVVLQYAGLQQQREFYTPVYDTKAQVDSRLPDTRNVLMWMPEIKTDEHGKQLLKFYTSDVTGRFALVIQGISTDGRPASKVITINVTK